jgi:hypothetical protein
MFIHLQLLCTCSILALRSRGVCVILVREHQLGKVAESESWVPSPFYLRLDWGIEHI